MAISLEAVMAESRGAARGNSSLGQRMSESKQGANFALNKAIQQDREDKATLQQGVKKGDAKDAVEAEKTRQIFQQQQSDAVVSALTDRIKRETEPVDPQTQIDMIAFMPADMQNYALTTYEMMLGNSGNKSYG